jgi:hypothetical protein
MAESTLNITAKTPYLMFSALKYTETNRNSLTIGKTKLY